MKQNTGEALYGQKLMERLGCQIANTKWKYQSKRRKKLATMGSYIHKS
jgi:hypothetical protein